MSHRSLPPLLAALLLVLAFASTLGHSQAPEWYLGIDGRREGPFTLGEVSSRIASGIVNGETLVWRDGMADWEAAGKVEALREKFAGPKPPPLPPLPSIPPSAPGIPPAAPRTENLTLTPSAWPVGKWPEGMAHDGAHLWVSESGQRTLAQLNARTGEIVRRVTSGRLPVGMVSNPITGHVFAEVATDQKLIKFSREGLGGAIASLPDYPNSITGDDKAIWLYLWVDGSNAESRVIRIDQNSAASIQSELLGPKACEISKSGNRLWINQADQYSTKLTLLDPDRLQRKQSLTVDGMLPAMATTEGSVLLGGGVWDVSGTLVRVDPVTMQETARAEMPGEFIHRIAADGDFVVAVGYHGSIRVYAIDDLALLRTIRLNWAGFTPASLLLHEETLFISVHNGQGENGTILAVSDWVPMRGHP